MKRATFSWFILLVLFAQALLAETVYKGTDANGKTIYSDQPIENGKKIEIILPTPMQLPQTAKEQTQKKEAETVDYRMSIVSPSDKQTFTNDINAIEVKLSIDPQLQDNDQVRLIINGQPFGQPSSTPTFTLHQFPRGAYSITGEIFSTDDPSKVKAKSQTVTIYQQRAIAKRDVTGLAPQAPMAPQAP